MPTRTANFFNSTVKPTVNEFLSDSKDIRRGRLAAIVLSHLVDYWALEITTTPKPKNKLREALISECPDFSIIWDVADATKHAQLDRVPRQLSSSDQITRPPSLFEAQFGTAVFNEASIVMVTLDNGTSHSLIEAVRSVLSMWEKKLG